MALGSVFGAVLGSPLRNCHSYGGEGSGLSDALKTFVAAFGDSPRLYYATDATDAAVPNAITSASASLNLLPRNSGSLEFATVPTEFNTLGPSGQQTAGKKTIAATTTVNLVQSKVLPTGTYTFAMQVKSSADNNVDFGISGGAIVDTAILAASYTKISCTFTSNGVATTTITFRNKTAGSLDYYFDELQLYSGSTVPVYSSADADDCLRVNILTTTNKFTKSGDAIDTGTGIQALIRPSTFPLKKSFAQGTFFAVASTADAAIEVAKLLGNADVVPAWDLGINKGNTYGAPGLARHLSPMKISGKGYFTLISTWKNGLQAFFINGIGSHSAFTKTALSIDTFRAFSDRSAISTTTYPFKGKISILGEFSEWLSDADSYSLHQKLLAKHNATAESDVTIINNWWIAEGDSITQEEGINFQYKYMQATAINIMASNFAVDGSNITHLPGRFAAVQKNITEFLAHNPSGRPIVSCFMGANFIEGTTIELLIDYWTACRTAGAKAIACTVLPRYPAGSAFEDLRGPLNTAIRGASAYYDGLADFAADAQMGHYTACIDYPLNWNVDQVHPVAAGHDRLNAIMQPIVDGLTI